MSVTLALAGSLAPGVNMTGFDDIPCSIACCGRLVSAPVGRTEESKVTALPLKITII